MISHFMIKKSVSESRFQSYVNIDTKVTRSIMYEGITDFKKSFDNLHNSSRMRFFQIVYSAKMTTDIEYQIFYQLLLRDHCAWLIHY